MFRKLLVANRGEIACRVIRTLRALGTSSVAVYHFVDRDAPHTAAADERVELRGRAPASAYLDIAQILAACKATGADALHPGYGFLSESAELAEACARGGVTFIGPSPEAMRALGDKLRSRELAITAGVPVSASAALGPGPIDARAVAALGFPLLIKASGGGGGKGMKVVRAPGELAAQVALARSEAERYFGDPRVYAERLIERPRHIEVQVLGDGAGNVIALGTRECSIQRRYQKIIEEAPAANLPPALLARIVDAGVRLARAARYGNAGTVEFLVAPDGEIAFLEMNTRLQVEHPVTELVTGTDLVEAQLRIAAGEPLPAVPAARGHAIECRVCAEEPEHGFRPATGRVGVLRLPGGPGVRVDSGIREGQDVTAAFDSLLLKLVTHGRTRAEASSRMRGALHDLVVLGVDTNVDYLSRIVASAPFAAGELHTGFLDDHAAALAPEPVGADTAAVALAAAALADADVRRTAFDIPEPYASLGGFRN
jgi:propionyl-CoA carboxylase alpha chain/3-methylcrotonyl-CoA carboxylase alpha subunit/acetyl-CoA/propionyl-CoA carboxylase biotin carboxyl carrier protein